MEKKPAKLPTWRIYGHASTFHDSRVEACGASVRNPPALAQRQFPIRGEQAKMERSVSMMNRFPSICRLALLISLALAAAVLAPSLVRAQSAEPAPAPPHAPASSTQGYGDRDKTCAAWTDTCVSCKIDSDGALHCSNIGIACQPQPVTCTERREPPHR